MDYSKLSLKLTGRCKTSRKLQNNTWVERRQGTAADKYGRIAVRLHRTDVLTFERKAGGEFVEFNTGGWETVTTKDRINGYAPVGFSVYSQRGDWYLYGPNARKDCDPHASWWERRDRWAFFDGITINVKTGKPMLAHVKQAEKLERERVEHRKEAARQARAHKRYIRVCEALAVCFSQLTYHERVAACAVSDMLDGLCESMCAPACAVVEGFGYLGEALEACYEVDDMPPDDATLAWHFVNEMKTTHDNTPIHIGRTIRVRGEVKACSSGLHASIRALDAHVYCKGPIVCRVLVWGAIDHHGSDKLAAEYRHVVWAVRVPEALNQSRYEISNEEFEAALEALPRVES